MAPKTKFAAKYDRFLDSVFNFKLIKTYIIQEKGKTYENFQKLEIFWKKKLLPFWKKSFGTSTEVGPWFRSYTST